MTTSTFLHTRHPLIDPEKFDGPTAITPEADLLTGVTDPGFNALDELLPSTYVIEAGENLRENGWNTLGQGVENVGQVMRSFGFDEAEDDLGSPTPQEQLEGIKQMVELYAPEKLKGPLDAAGKISAVVDYATFDPANPTPTISKIKEAEKNNDTKTINRARLTPISTGSQILHENAVRTVHDPNASAGDKILNVVVDTVVQVDPVTNTYKGFEKLFSAIGNWTGWWDEDEEDLPAFRDEFSSNPETLTPFNIDIALITDNYQQQDAPGADLIAGEANQGMDPYQAKEERYEVLA